MFHPMSPDLFLRLIMFEQMFAAIKWLQEHQDCEPTVRAALEREINKSEVLFEEIVAEFALPAPTAV